MVRESRPTNIDSPLASEAVLGDFAPHPYQSLNGEGVIRTVNDAWLDLLGYERADAEGKWFGDFLVSESADRFEVQFLAFKSGDGDSDVEFEIRHADGHVIVVSFDRRIERDADGNFVRMHCQLHDITAHRERDRELTRYREIVEASNDIAMIADPEGRMTYVSPSVRRVLGYDAVELLGEEGYEYIHPDDREAVDDAIASLQVEPDKPQTVEARFRRVDGSWCWIEATMRNLLDNDIIEGILVNGRDITARKEREQELARQKRLLDALFEYVPIHLFVRDEAGRHLWMSSGLVDDPERWIGRTDTEVEVGATQAFSEEAYADDRRVIDHDERIINKEEYNEVLDKWFLTSKVPWYDEDGAVIGLLGYSVDVTERKKREEQLKAIHNATRTLVKAETDAEIAEITAEAAHDILDMSVNGIWLHDDAENVLKPIFLTDEATDLIGDPPVFEPGGSLSWDVFQSGEVKLFDDVSTEPGRYNPETPIRSEIILPVGAYGVMNIGSTETGSFTETDVSLAQILAANAEAALVRADRSREIARQNDRLEEFASVVSHDLQNPLSVAEGQLELARRDCDSEHLDAISRAHNRMEELITDLLSLAREGKRVGAMGSVNLADLIQTCWQNIETDGATLVVDTDVAIRADRGRLQQLLENLIRNAVEHGGKQTTVRVGELPNGFYIADDGPGISADKRDRVFESGYSTAEEGTGFGLPIVAEIAEAHGWEISVTDGAEGGARFEITSIETDA
ncbi:MAG: PAS domain S-box protein [Haloarcula sp.]